MAAQEHRTHKKIWIMPAIVPMALRFFVEHQGYCNKEHANREQESKLT